MAGAAENDKVLRNAKVRPAEPVILPEAVARGYMLCKFLRTDLAASHKDKRKGEPI